MIGDALVHHPDVALISFTGSPEVGWGIRAAAPRKRVGLELGNNSPLIVCADGDWQAAAAAVRLAGFAHAGQSCISTQRILVDESIKDDFVAELVEQVETLVVGDPLDEATEVSALIDRSNTERVRSWVEAAVGRRRDTSPPAATRRPRATCADGAGRRRPARRRLRQRGVRAGRRGAWLHRRRARRWPRPTTRGTGCRQRSSPATSTSRCGRPATLDYGGVLINEVPTWRADHMPYGGLRDSGNTREGPAWAIREMTEERLVVIKMGAGPA